MYAIKYQVRICGELLLHYSLGKQMPDIVVKSEQLP